MEHDIGPVDQIPLGEGRNFRVGATTIAVFRTHAGKVFATQPNCPHRQGPLADGLIGGTTLVCPLHDRAFDLRTGQEAGADCRLSTYATSVGASGTICVAIPSPDQQTIPASG